MSKSINNLVQATKNTVNAAINTVSLATQVVADGTEVVNNSISQAKPTTMALLATPCAAVKGYIMESEGVSAEVAEERAYRYVRQELSRTIEEVGVGSGKLLADLLKEDLAEDGKAVEKAKQ